MSVGCRLHPSSGVLMQTPGWGRPLVRAPLLPVPGSFPENGCVSSVLRIHLSNPLIGALSKPEPREGK